MKRKYKAKVLKSISDNLKYCNPEYNNKFLCPVCMELFDLEDLDNISEAHILPESTGNELTTWLCHDCNTKFGRKQDKWLGEYINIKKDKTYFNKKTTIKGIYINKNKVYGEIIHDDNGISIYIQENRNSEDTISKLGKLSRNIELDVKIPVLSKSDEIDVGLITAAYLFCFNKFGYSWIMQSYLDGIRDIISNNRYIKNENVHISKVKSENQFDDLEFGFTLVGNDYLLMVKIHDNIVFFSPFYKKMLSSSLLKYDGKYNLTIKVAKGLFDRNYPKPFMLTIDDKMMIYPDMVKNRRDIDDLVLIDSNKFETIFLKRNNHYSKNDDEKEEVRSYRIRMKDIER